MSLCTAENSMRSATSFAINACITHFILGKISPTKANEKLPDGAKHTVIFFKIKQ